MKKKLALLLVLLIALSSATALADYGAILKKNARIYTNAKMKTSLGKIPKYISVIVKSAGLIVKL